MPFSGKPERSPGMTAPTRKVSRLLIVGALLFALLTFDRAGTGRAIPAAPTTRPPASALCPQWWRLARSVGWAEHNLPLLDRIIWRESRCLPDVENLADPWGGSIGLTQVNRGWVRWLREGGVIEHSSDLFSPRANLAAALAIYHYACARHGQCWVAWGMLQA